MNNSVYESACAKKKIVNYFKIIFSFSELSICVQVKYLLLFNSVNYKQIPNKKHLFAGNKTRKHIKITEINPKKVYNYFLMLYFYHSFYVDDFVTCDV